MWWPFPKKRDSAETARQQTGRWGERQAERHLRRRGFRILGRRVRVGRRDELDLVARDGDTLVFIEVRTRKNENFGSPISSVRRAKRRALSRAAVRYLLKLRRPPAYFRFDVVEVIGIEGGGEPEIRHIPNAFTLHPSYRLPW